ncbi:MAG: glycerophosphodiester phosphodiesterase family protein [Patescibacteria group bacterium]|nr:glycerophosphodiester phosphodiesterase family protein [Patescibacteria group bacterium]
MMKIIGHRGAKGLAPENTAASFEKAIDCGVDEIELDVRVSRDGVVVVQHDAELHDPAGNHLSVKGSDYATLLAHKPDLMTFTAAMQLINRRVPVLIEVKPDVSTAPVIAEITALQANGWLDADMLLGSFSQPILRELHQALPTITKVVIERWSGVRATWRARQVNTKRLNMQQLWLWSGFIRAMQRNGYQLAPYTLNDPHKARRWAKVGIYAVITDFPDRFQPKDH